MSREENKTVPHVFHDSVEAMYGNVEIKLTVCKQEQLRLKLCKNFGQNLLLFVYKKACNGFVSAFFVLNRGLSQACPLSELLFVVEIGLLGNAIRQSQSTNGIKIG